MRSVFFSYICTSTHIKYKCVLKYKKVIAYNIKFKIDRMCTFLFNFGISHILHLNIN